LLTGHASISGQVFGDPNGNGFQDLFERGLPGRTVYVDANEDGALGKNEPAVTTDAKGGYAFSGLTSGTYTVREIIPDGFDATDQNAGSAVVKVTGHQEATVSFGNQELYRIIPKGGPGYTYDGQSGTATFSFSGLDPDVYTLSANVQAGVDAPPFDVTVTATDASGATSTTTVQVSPFLRDDFVQAKLGWKNLLDPVPSGGKQPGQITWVTVQVAVGPFGVPLGSCS
jgi:hypothetical protein